MRVREREGRKGEGRMTKEVRVGGVVLLLLMLLWLLLLLWLLSVDGR